ncbi:hypothetical protein L1887_29831 [Cichorium endivia]|nr:hypothetical protein L1887_29831 [Cichorium endivia]
MRHDCQDAIFTPLTTCCFRCLEDANLVALDRDLVGTHDGVFLDHFLTAVCHSNPSLMFVLSSSVCRATFCPSFTLGLHSITSDGFYVLLLEVLFYIRIHPGW